MGIDVLELSFRLEDQFKVACDELWFMDSFGEHGFARTTAGSLLFHVGCLIAETYGEAPPNLWERIREILSEVTRTPLERIQLGSRLREDLGLT